VAVVASISDFFKVDPLNFSQILKLMFVLLLAMGCVSTFVVERNPNLSDFSQLWPQCDFEGYECAFQSQADLKNPELGILQAQNRGRLRSSGVVRGRVNGFLLGQSSVHLSQSGQASGNETQVLQAVSYYCHQYIPDTSIYSLKIQDVAWQKYFRDGSQVPLFSVSVLYLIPKASYQHTLDQVVRHGVEDKNRVVSQFFKFVQTQVAMGKS
jgi:hypothetical protein